MVIRVEKTKNYTIMSNYHLKDENISLKAKGLLSMILSLPEEWNYTQEGLATRCRDGVDSVRSALNELKELGYIETSRVRDEKGRLREAEYVIHEVPVSYIPEGKEPDKEEPCSEAAVCEESLLEEPVCDKPVVEKSNLKKSSLEEPILKNASLEKPAQLNTNILNTQELNTNISNQNAADIKPVKKLDSRRAYYPDNEQLDKAFKAFVYMRKRINKPLTNVAIALIKDSLVKLAGEDGKLNIEKAIGILNQSVMNGWLGLYELKTPVKNKEQPSGYSAYSAEEWEHLENLVLAN